MATGVGRTWTSRACRAQNTRGCLAVKIAKPPKNRSTAATNRGISTCCRQHRRWRWVLTLGIFPPFYSVLSHLLRPTLQQRIGRAGRKDGNALNITVAEGNPHDQFFFEEPLEMMQGRCRLPASSSMQRLFSNASWQLLYG